MGLIENLESIKSEKDSKILPENIKYGVKIFDVIGDYSGLDTAPIKTFETVEEMNADEGAKEGDIAVVYKPILTNITTSFAIKNGTVLYFPDIVTLDSAITSAETITINGTTYKYNCYLTDSNFEIVRTNRSDTSDSISMVEYTSTDGITYTKINGVDCEIFYMTSVYRISNANINKFFNSMTGEFNGIYEYNTSMEEYTYDAYINPDFTDKKFTSEYATMDVEKVVAYLKTNLYTHMITGTSALLIITEDDMVYDVYCHNASGTARYACGLLAHDGVRYITTYRNMGSVCTTFYKAHIDFNTNTHVVTEIEPEIYDYMKVCDTFTSTAKITFYPLAVAYTGYLSIYDTNNTTTPNNTACVNKYCMNTVTSRYRMRPNQFTVSLPSQLLEGAVVLGKNGVVTSDGSIYNSIPAKLKMHTAFNNSEIVENGNRLCVAEYDKNIAYTKPALDIVSNSVSVPIKLREHTGENNDNIVVLYKNITDCMYNRYHNRIIKENADTQEIYILDAETKELIYTYPDVYISRATSSTSFTKENKYFGIEDDLFVSIGWDNTSMYIYKFNTLTEYISKITITPGGDAGKGATPFNFIGYNPDKRSICIGVNLDISTNKRKFEIGYVNIDTGEYTSIFTKNINYESYAYDLLAYMTSNKDIIINWYIYGSPLRYWSYLINADGNIISSVEDTTVDLDTIPISDTHKLFTQRIMYDDGTYLYHSSTGRINKNTLANETYNNSYITRVSSDFTYGVTSDGVDVYSLPAYDNIYKNANVPHQIIYFPETSTTFDNDIINVNGEFITIGTKNNVIIDSIYGWDLADMSDYDLLLIGPACVNGNVSVPQYKYVWSDKYKQSGNGPISQKEYDTAIDTASEILGEEVSE